MEGPQGRRRLRRGPTSPIEIPGVWFTAMDMAAAEQLIQLSESSVESAVDEEALTIAPMSISSALSSSSSPLSVGSSSVPPGNRMPPFAVAEDDDDDDLRRLRARYRKLEEVYAEGASADFGGRMWPRRKIGDLEWSGECC